MNDREKIHWLEAEVARLRESVRMSVDPSTYHFVVDRAKRAEAKLAALRERAVQELSYANRELDRAYSHVKHESHLHLEDEEAPAICKSVDDVCENLKFCLIHNPARVRVFDNDRKEEQ